MTLRAKCKHPECGWKLKASGSVYLHLAMKAHRDNTGHKVKIKEK